MHSPDLVTTFSDTGLTAGTDYYYQARASASNINSDWSPAAAATTGGVKVTGSSEVEENSDPGFDLQVSFTSPDAGRHVDHWDVNWGDGGSAVTIDDAGDDGSASHIYVQDGAYTVTVTAYDDFGNAQTKTLSANVLEVDPTLTIGTSQGASPTDEITEGSPLIVDVSYEDPADEVDGWTIDWGDGQSDEYEASPGHIVHDYEDDGTFTVTATAQDEEGDHEITSQVVVDEVRPTVQASSLELGTENTPFQFNMSYEDPADAVTSWQVDWGDGSAPSSYGAGATSAQHVYTDPGFYAVTATATDDDGSYDANAFTVQIRNQPPVVAASLDGAEDGSITVDVPATVTLSTTFDDNPNVAGQQGEVTSWIINWDDGTVETKAGSERTFTHQYLSGNDVPESHEVQAVAIAEDGAVRANTLEVVTQGSSIPRTLILGITGQLTFEAMENQSIELSIVNSKLSGETQSPSGSYTIKWGDGTESNASGTADGPNTNRGYISHTYANEGHYLVDVTAGDGHREQGWLWVHDGRATVAAIGDLTGTVGQSVTVSTTFSAADTEDTYKAFVDWGDGRGQIPAQVSGSTITATLEHAPAGEYAGKIYLYDQDGSTNGPGEISHFTSFHLSGLASMRAKLADGAENGIIQGSYNGKTDVVPLELDYPEYLPPGTLLQIEENAPEMLIWETGNPDRHDTPIAVGGGSPLIWAPDPGSDSKTFYVGTLQGSSGIGAIFIILTAVATAPVKSAPASQPTTRPETPSNKDSNVWAELKFNETDVNEGSKTGGKAGRVLVGQDIPLKVVLHDPTNPNLTGIQYQWTVDGDRYAEYDLSTTPDKQNPTLKKLDGDALKKNDIDFFWTDGDEGADGKSIAVKCQITGSALQRQPMTTFYVQKPTATIEDPKPGKTTVAEVNGETIGVTSADTKDFDDHQGRKPVQEGLEIPTTVKMPDNFANPGKWAYLQTIKMNDSASNKSTSFTNGQIPNELLLDLKFPYPILYHNSDRSDLVPNDVIFDAIGRRRWFRDTPTAAIKAFNEIDAIKPDGSTGHFSNIDHLVRDLHLSAYLMFLPPEQAGGHNRWVPLKEVDWRWSVSMVRVNGPEGLTSKWTSSKELQNPQVDSVKSTNVPPSGWTKVNDNITKWYVKQT